MRERNTRIYLLFFILIFAATGCALFQTEETADPTPTSAAASEPAADPTAQPEPAAEPAITAPESPPSTEAENDSTTETGQSTVGLAEPVFEPGRCPFPVPEGADVSCGTVELPQNRQDPQNEQTVKLAAAIFHSTAADPGDPVVYLAGGPGGYALEIIPFTYEDSIAPFLADRDYVIFDQRGTGYSTPSLACPETFDLDLELLDDNLSQEDYGDRYLDSLADCRDRLLNAGIDLSAFNSVENAADVDALRQALGYDSWHLFGVSYGTRLAQTVMRDYPDGIISVILDSPYPLEVDLQESIPGHITRAFRVFFDGCAADAACQAAYPNLEENFYDLVDELNENPLEFPIIYFLTGTEYDVVFNGDDLIDLLFQSLYSNEIFPLLPRVIYEIDEGETETLGLIFATFLVNGEFISTGMYRSVQCNEELAFSDLDRVEAASGADPLLADYFANWDLSYEACDLWSAGTADPLENQPVSSPIPTLIMTGEYDPITPPAWGEQVAANLSNEILIEFPSIGHGAVSSADCPLQIALAFLRDPELNGVESCVIDILPPPFDAPALAGEAGEAEEIALVPFEVELPPNVTMTGLRPESWEENGPGIYLRGLDIVDQTGIIYQTVPTTVASAEEYAEFFIEQLGAEPPASENLKSYADAQDRDWTIYETEIGTSPILIAVTVEGDQILAIVMITNSGEVEILRPVVFEPGMDALNVK